MGILLSCVLCFFRDPFPDALRSFSFGMRIGIYPIISILISSAGAECVSAPTEM
jgi:hypothetical protein